MIEHQELIALLAQRSVRRGHFTLASGKTSELYVDARMTSMSAEGLSLIGPIGLRAIRTAGWEVDVVGGMTLGADPIAYAISYTSSLHPPLIQAFTVRKETKTHGTGRLIEGLLQKGDRVVVVEDVITTGASALRAIDAVTNAGGKVQGVLALVDREDGGRKTIEDKGYRVISLVQIGEILALIPASTTGPDSSDV
jgi:orotate phosphoribosyltransferase